MRTVFKYYKSYIPLIVGILAFLFGQAMCELALPGYMSDIINNGSSKGRYGLYLEDRHDHDPRVSCGVWYALSSAVICRRGRQQVRLTKIRGRCSTKSRIFSCRNCRSFPASPITRSTNDVQMVQQTTVMTLRLACFAPIMGIGAVIRHCRTSVFFLDGRRRWRVIVVIMLMSFFLVLPKFKVLQEKLDRINLIMKERLTGLLVIRAFTTEKQKNAV